MGLPPTAVEAEADAATSLCGQPLRPLAAAETAPGRVLEGVYSLGVILEVKRKALEQANKF